MAPCRDGCPIAQDIPAYLQAMLENDPEKARTVREQFDRCARSYPYPSEIEGEKELIALADGIKASGNR